MSTKKIRKTDQEETLLESKLESFETKSQIIKLIGKIKILLNKKREVLGEIFGVNFRIIILVLIFAVLLTNTSLAAQSADNILRPLIGEKNTLILESVYFNLGDKLSYWRYIFFGQQSPLSDSPIHHSAPKNSRMNLSPIHPFLGLSSLVNEGVWQPMLQNSYLSQTVMARTFIRPDTTRPYALVSLVKIDMKKIAIGDQAGTYYPGGIYKRYGPGIVPLDIQKKNKLLAVFNGGFQARDGQYGMIVGKITYVPLRPRIPLLIITNQGSAKFVDYNGGKLDKNVASIRQNGPFLVRDGVITSFNEEGSDTWGRTVTNSMYTWRSGLGVTKDGNLVYGVGNSLIPQTLAMALRAAGAVDAIQLDINPFWVRFITYQSRGDGKYSYMPLLNTMPDAGEAYLKGYNKDFFYLYKK